jgi:hypothetical protein
MKVLAYEAGFQTLTRRKVGASDKCAMSPFSVTVFRIRLLLLAAALGMVGFGSDKPESQVAESAKPIKVVSKAHHNAQQPGVKIVAVERASVGR